MYLDARFSQVFETLNGFYSPQADQHNIDS